VVGVACAAPEPRPQPPAPKPQPPRVLHAEQDALWALAPAGAEVGLVASADGVAAIDHTLANLRDVVHTPKLRFVLDGLGTDDLTLANFGLAPDHPTALFMAGDEIVVLPVADRERLAARLGRSHGGLPCTTVGGKLACATSAGLLASLGNGKLGIGELGQRGDVEVAIAPRDDEVRLLGAAELAPGTAVVHAAITHVPQAAIDMFGPPVKPAGDLTHAAGFFAIDARRILSSRSTLLAVLARTFSGPVTATMPTRSGAIVDLRVPLSDPHTAQNLIDHCGEVFEIYGVTVANGSCHIPEDPAHAMPASDLWVESGELRFSTRNAQPGPVVALGPLGTELARTSWTFVVYGHGTVLGTPAHDQLLANNAVLATSAALEELALAGRFEGTTLRLVLGARTIWSNPPEVAHALAAFLTTPSFSRADELVAIARRAPGSPFAADQRAGNAGMMGAIGVGTVMFVAVERAIFDWTKEPRNEAVAALGRLGKAAQAYRKANGAYPVGKAELTPAAPCCQGPALHCPVVEWSDPTWKALGFAVDKAGLYQYAYRSDGKTFTATAIGDLDCDGISVVYTLTGNADGTTALTEPTPGSD
jgi:hypothetical protein